MKDARIECTNKEEMIYSSGVTIGRKIDDRDEMKGLLCAVSGERIKCAEHVDPKIQKRFQEG